MISKIFSVILLVFVLTANGQNTDNFTAMILSLDGEGVIIRNAKEQALELPQRYFPGDVLSVKRGNAVIMLFSGEEIPLAAVSNYTIPVEESVNSSELYEMANDNKADQSLLAQAGLAYSIRGKSNVFPMKSKVLNSENVILHLAYANPKELNLGLKVIDAKTQKVVFEKESISDSIISLTDVLWTEGKSYYWTLSNTPDGKPEMGTIVIPGNNESQNYLNPKEPQTHFEFMNTISSYYNGRYYFDAYALIQKAIAEYPGFEIYTVLLENLLLE
jgi:hypothetical protein